MEISNSLASGMDELVARRLAVLCPGFVFNISATMARWVDSLREKSLNNKVIVFRSLVNSWTTSYRFHEAVLLPCVFGCSLQYPKKEDATFSRDELAHYLVCKPLWRLVSDILNQDFCGLRAPDRLGVGKVCKFEGIVLAHQMYHYVKLSRYQDFLCCRSFSDIDKIREAAFRFGLASLVQ